MELYSEVSNFTAESVLKWKINCSKLKPSSNYTIKSKEIFFKEANATWFLTVSAAQLCRNCIKGGDRRYMCEGFCRSDNKTKSTLTISRHDDDKNHVITCSCQANGTLSMPHSNSVRSSSIVEFYFEFNIIDSILEIEAKILLETIKHDIIEEVKEDEVISIDEPEENDFEVVENSNQQIQTLNYEKIQTKVTASTSNTTSSHNASEKNQPELQQKTVESGPSTSSNNSNDTDSELDSSSSMDCEVSMENAKEVLVDEAKLQPDYKMSDSELNELIQKIYLIKMKQVANASSKVFMISARNNLKVLLEESCKAFAAQMDITNFPVIWKIATQLKAEPLKKAVVDFVVANKLLLWPDILSLSHKRFTKDLMEEVVASYGRIK